MLNVNLGTFILKRILFVNASLFNFALSSRSLGDKPLLRLSPFIVSPISCAITGVSLMNPFFP